MHFSSTLISLISGGVGEWLDYRGLYAIELTSGGEAYVLASLLRFAKSHDMDINIPVYSFGPYTTRCAHEAGLIISATSPHFHSFDDYVQFWVEQV